MLLYSILSTLYSHLIWHWMEQAGIQVKVQHCVNNSESLQSLGLQLSKKRSCPCYLNPKQGLHQFMVVGYEMRYNLMSIWIFISKILALLIVCGSHYIWGSDKAEKGTQAVLGGFFSQPRCACEFGITQEGVSDLPAKEWCLLISRAAAGHRHANTHTYTQTHRASTCLYLSVLGRWLLVFGSPHPAAHFS